MSDDLLNELEKFKSQYYSDNKKNMIFKSTQKNHLANSICEQFGTDDLFIRTSFIIPNTNKIYITYPLLKLFANPSNYEQFTNYVQSLFLRCINQYGSFECHVNLESLTVTAVERNKKLIEIFARDPSENGGIEYTSYLTTLCMYNTPNVIDNIRQIISYLIEPELMNKITTYNKKESIVKLNELL